MDAANKDGGTPLHLSSQQGHESVVRLLLDKGAKMDAAGKDGGTFLYTGGILFHKEWCAALDSYGVLLSYVIASIASHITTILILISTLSSIHNLHTFTGKYWASVNGVSSCVLCSAGTWSALAASICNDGPTGTFNPTSGGSAISSCLSCQAGYDSGQTGKSVCDACNAGMFRGVLEEYQRAMAITPYCRSIVSYGVVHYKTLMFFNHNHITSIAHNNHTDIYSLIKNENI